MTIRLTELFRNLLQDTKMAKRKYEAAMRKFENDNGDSDSDLFDEVIETRKDYSYAKSKLGKFIVEYRNYVIVRDEY